MGRLEGRQGHWSRKGGLGEREVLVGLESGRLILMGQACDALWTVLLLSKSPSCADLLMAGPLPRAISTLQPPLVVLAMFLGLSPLSWSTHT